MTFKIYRVAGGRVVGVETIEAKAAEEAIELASKVVGDEASELWLGDRLIKSFNQSPRGRT